MPDSVFSDHHFAWEVLKEPGMKICREKKLLHHFKHHIRHEAQAKSLLGQVEWVNQSRLCGDEIQKGGCKVQKLARSVYQK